MKKVLVFVLFLLCTCAYAEGNDLTPIYDFAENHGAGELTQMVGESIQTGNFDVWETILGWLKTEAVLPVRRVCETAIVSILPVMLLAIIRGCLPETNGASGGACFLLRMMLLLGFADLASLSLSAAKESIMSVKDFSDTAAPVVSAVLSLTGMNGTAALVSPAAALVGNIAEGVFVKYGLPVCRIALCGAIAGNLSEAVDLSRFTKLMKKAANWGAGLITTLFTGLIALQGTVAEAADSIGMRTAKFAADSVSPVIGSGITDAWDGFVSGVMVTKNALGLSGITAVLAAGFRPLICCAASMLVLSLIASLLELFGERETARAAEELGGICQMALSMVTGSLVIAVVLMGAAMSVGRNLIA